MVHIKLQSSDNEIFETEVQIIKCSGILRSIIDNCQLKEDEHTVIPLPNVNAAILRKILEWANFHKDDPQPADDDGEEERCTDDISPWDAEFLKVEKETLYGLILAANYLNIKGLMDIGCKTIANMIKGKTPEEIRTTFNIVNDFTPAEEEQVWNENDWCEEN